MDWEIASDGSVWIAYADKPGEVRALSAPNVAIEIKGGLVFDTMRLSSNGTALALRYSDSSGEVKLMPGASHDAVTLATLDLGVEEFVFTPDSTLLFVGYADGRVHLLDLEWLTALAEKPSLEASISLACERIRGSGHFDDAALTPFLDGQPPRGCQ